MGAIDKKENRVYKPKYELFKKIITSEEVSRENVVSVLEDYCSRINSDAGLTPEDRGDLVRQVEEIISDVWRQE